MTEMRYPPLASALTLAGVFLVCPAGAACCPDVEKGSSAMVTIGAKDNGRMVDIRVDEVVQIILPENATTGYRWEIERYDEEFIVALEAKPRYAQNGIGSSGEVEFTFRGKKAGTGKIALKQWRHWAGEDSVISRFHINLHILP